MAYIINISGESGYTRNDFVNALGGKQDKLVSSTNIRTVGGQSVLGSGNLDFTTPQEYNYDLTGFQESMRDDAIARINYIKSINPNNNMMVFGLITDLHTMPTKEEILADETASSAIKEAWPTSDPSYYGKTCEHSLKLLGSICYEIGADAVFCAGDLSSGMLPFDCYTFMLGKIKGLFDKYISVPHFVTEGNHDRWYGNNSSTRCRTNEEWLAYLKTFNTPGMASYIGANETINDNSVNMSGEELNFPANTYYIDFGNKKVRVIMRSEYERQQTLTDTPSSRMHGTSPFWYAVYQCLSFANPSDAEDYTVLTVTHYNRYDTTDSTYLASYYSKFLSGDGFSGTTTHARFTSFNQGHHGHAAVGELYGHLHNTGDKLLNDGSLQWLRIGSPAIGSVASLDSQDSYKFSVFLLDTDAYKLYEVKVGNQEISNCTSSAFRQVSSVSQNGWMEYDVQHNITT